MAGRKKRRRLGTYFVIGILLAAALVFFRWQQTGLQGEEITVYANRLPQSFDGLRVCIVSDLHGAEFGKDNERLLRAVSKQNPDLIAITGDVIDSPEEVERLPALAKGLSAIAPTYYVTGNHEWATREVPQIIGIFEQCGVLALENEAVELSRGREKILLAGIHDPNGRLDQKKLKQLAKELRETYEDPYILLLAHRNTEFPEYARNRVDLVLAGHGHGGIIRLPFTDGLIGTERNLLPTWTAGLYELEETQMVVSRGLGNIPGLFRLFNRPHLPVVVLHCANP